MAARGRSKTRVAVAVALLAGAAVATFAVVQSGDPENAKLVEARRPLEACAATAGETREQCFQRAFDRAAAEGTVTQTLRALESLVAEGALDDCHLEAHSLAHAAYAVVRNVRRVFLLGRDECRAGYLHGAVEASASGENPESVRAHAIANPPCDHLRTRELRGACSHGFGHALMLARGHDVRASIRGCIQAADRGVGVAACEVGVMMQNSMRYTDLDEEEFRRRASGGCTTVAVRRLRKLCYGNLGVIAALTFGHDARRTASLCRRLPDRLARAACLTRARKEIEESQGARRR